MSLSVVLLVWFLVGSFITNLTWVMSDLKHRLIKDNGKYDSDYYSRIYSRGLIIGFILGPITAVLAYKIFKEHVTELEEFEKSGE